MASRLAKPRIHRTEVAAAFTPDDPNQASWSGRLTQTIAVRMIDADGELIEGTKRIEWNRPMPSIDYFPTAEGELVIGDKRCRAFWSGTAFVHSGGWAD